jgi:hypothetical protein
MINYLNIENIILMGSGEGYTLRKFIVCTVHPVYSG